MKKPNLNINFGDGGFQGWLVRHCEKMILGVVILLALWVIWGGYGLPGLDGGKSPEKLRSDAENQRTEIARLSWDQFAAANPDRLQRAVTGDPRDELINPLDYPRPNSWNPADFPQNTKRTDPEVYPPIDLKVVPIVGPLAYQPLASLKDPLTGEMGRGGAVPQRVGGVGAAPVGRGPMGPMGDIGDMGDMPPGGAEPGADPLTEFAQGGAPGDPMDPMGGMGGAMGGGAPRVMQVESSHYQAPPNSIAKSKYAVVLMAAVQHEKQWEEFDRKLRESLDWDQTRDQPNYLTFFVQRVDVTDDPTIDPATIPDDAWKSVSNKPVLEDAMKWAGYPREVVDPAYLAPVDPAGTRMGLTQPIPPFVQRDLWEAMTHPDIPLANAARQTPQFAPAEETIEEEGVGEIPGIPGVGTPGRRRATPGAMMPGAQMPGMMPGAQMPGMMPGAQMPGAQMPGMMPGAQMPGMMPGAQMPGMMPGAQMPGMGVRGYSQAALGPQVKYKLIRVTDFSVEPGRKYRYRLKVVLDDPNNSQLFDPPSRAALDPEVNKRVETEGATKPYLDSKEWSAPSDVVSLPDSHWFFAGEVDSDSGQPLVEGTRPVRREPTAKIVCIVHDPAKGADVPLQQEVRPGSTINLKAEVNVVHPIRMDVHNFKDYPVRTDTLVADMIGGGVIPNIHRDGEKMTVPGEILLIDADGNLFVQDEAEDVEDFRRYVPPEEDKQKKPVADDPMNPMNPMDPMMEPGGGVADPMGGMGTKRRGKRGM